MSNISIAWGGPGAAFLCSLHGDVLSTGSKEECCACYPIEEERQYFNHRWKSANLNNDQYFLVSFFCSIDWSSTVKTAL